MTDPDAQAGICSETRLVFHADSPAVSDEKVITQFGMMQGVTHTEFIRGRDDGEFYFLETPEIVFVANWDFLQYFKEIVHFHILCRRVAICDFDERLARLAYGASGKIKNRQIKRIMAESADRFAHSVAANQYLDLYEKMPARPVIG